MPLTASQLKGNSARVKTGIALTKASLKYNRSIQTSFIREGSSRGKSIIPGLSLRLLNAALLKRRLNEC